MTAEPAAGPAKGWRPSTTGATPLVASAAEGRSQFPTLPKALPIAKVEQRVADCYRAIALTAEQRERIERSSLAKLRRQEAQAAERVDQLNMEASSIERQQIRLLEAYYPDAVPQALFVKDQQRLNTERARNDHKRKTAAATLADLEQKMRDALDLLQDAHQTYQQATLAVRKQLNRALFARILLGDEPAQVRAELNEPYKALTSGNAAGSS